jgi:hypothetical protein
MRGGEMPESEAKKKTVTLAFEDWRYDEHDFKVEGVDPIRKEGTEVPADKEKEVREKAAKRRMKLRKL